MTVDELISYLRENRVRIWAESSKLKFRAPQGAITKDVLRELGNHKAALLNRLGETHGSEENFLKTAPRDQELPLSAYQEAIWFMHQLHGGTAADHLSYALQISGALEVDALRQGVAQIVERHEILRTTYRQTSSGPRQVVHPDIVVDIEMTDLRGGAPVGPDRGHNDSEGVDSLAQGICVEIAHRSFDLQSDAPLRFALVRQSDTRWVFVTVMHHIASDHRSFGLFFHELQNLYSHLSMDHPISLPELPVQYSDYAAWLHAEQNSQHFTEELTYWQQQIGDERSILELPTDYQRPAQQSPIGARVPVEIAPAVLENVRRLGQNEGATLFMTVLAAVQALLHRYTGQSTVTVGSPVSVRGRPELENLIGLFLNVVLMRTDMSGDPSFRELLRRVRRVALGAYANPDVPFERLVGMLRPDRDLSRNPLFQVMVELSPAEELRLHDLDVKPFDFDPGTSQFDLSFHFKQENARLHGHVEFDTCIFTPARISRILGHLEVLLTAVAETPDAPLSRIDILTRRERSQLLVEWNDTAAPYPADRCVQHLFEVQVQRTPDATSVEFDDKRLSYAELNRRANQLAHVLRSREVGPGTLVGLMLERSVNMVVGVLATLKAGAAYVPMDPAFPAERLRFMLEDSQATILLTDGSSQEPLAWGGASFRLDQSGEILASAPATNVETEATPDDLAYVIYTSGSTGQPKGVMVPHRAVVNFLSSMARVPGMSAGDRIVAVTTLSFDIHVLELLLPLTAGATTIVAPTEVAADGRRLIDLLTRSRASMMQATPATWRMLVSADWCPPAGFKLLCGGEALAQTLATELLARNDEVWNMYGPTETTVWSTCERLSSSGTVSIGRPVDNTLVYVLDQQMRPTPVGVPGELYIGGAGVTKGYLGREELTSSRFVTNPFDASGGGLLYRTGDLVSYRQDGRIDYHRRLDDQVKVRGFRIELGEVEAALMRHPGIENATVRKRRDDQGENQLIGYIAAPLTERPNISELRGFLLDSLPVYMVPTSFVTLERLPLTPNGKVDKNALPEQDSSRPDLDSEFAAPRDEREARIAEIWRDLLKIDKVGVNDNFFDVGGHSMLLMQLRLRLETEFSTEVSLVDLFRHATVAQLSSFFRGSPDETKILDRVMERADKQKRMLLGARSKGRRRHAGRNEPEQS